jgi:hypothetical protein
MLCAYWVLLTHRLVHFLLSFLLSGYFVFCTSLGPLDLFLGVRRLGHRDYCILWRGYVCMYARMMYDVYLF